MSYSETKSIQKSIRMTQQVHDFVDGQTGEGFNQKFENTIRRFIWEEQSLDERIKDKRHELAVMTSKLAKLQNLCRKIDTFASAAHEVELELDALIHPEEYEL